MSRGEKHCFVSALVLGSVLLLGGCHKKGAESAPPTPPPAKPIALETAPDTAPPPPPSSDPGQASPPTPQAEASPAAGSGYQVDEKLFPILDRYYNDKLRPAMSWQDLVSGRYIPSIPVGPDGKALDWNTTMQRLGKSAAARAGH
jgi:hypothetical protein